MVQSKNASLVKNETKIKKVSSINAFRYFQNVPVCHPVTGIISLKYFSSRNIEDDHSIKTDLDFSYFR